MRTIKRKIEVLDYMISRNRYSYHCDPWYEEPGSRYYKSICGISGEIRYKGEIFVVVHEDGHSGMGGMDEGCPSSVTIHRVHKEK